MNKLQDDVLENCNENIKNVLEEKTLNLRGIKENLIQNREISRYFILLYQVLKLIHFEILKFPSTFLIGSSEWEKEKLKKKKFYTNLIRSQQDNKTLQLLFINCFDDGFFEYKRYLEDASFFEHMSFRNTDNSYNYLMLSALRFYVLDRALLISVKDVPFFDRNLELLQFKDSFILSHIYEFHDQNFNEFDFLRSIIRNNFPYGTKFLEEVNQKNILSNLGLPLDYVLSFELNDNSLRENIVVKLSIFNIELGISNVRLIGKNNEEVSVYLNTSRGVIIELKKLDDGKTTSFDGRYILGGEAH